MNERIQELAAQADQYAIAMNPDEDSYGRSANPRKFSQDRDAKFAELIVKECINTIQNESMDSGDEWEDGLRIAEGAIREHFGVEE